MSEDDQEESIPGDSGSIGSRVSSDIQTFTALASDFYRGEVDRATSWRTRLDQTTNWAVIVVAAVLTWAFSGENRPHYVILIGIFAVTAFLLMETNRYREYDVWRDRVRTVQTGLIAEAFAPEETTPSDWQAKLSEDLRNPSLHLSFREAMNHRLRRSFLALITVLVIAWTARITVFIPDETMRQTARILFIPGEIVISVVGLFYGILIVITVWSAHGPRTEEFQA